MNRLKIAVTKGRLLEDSLNLFERMGFDCSEVRADTRKLILPIKNYPLDVVLSKAADVLTYVSHGVCDLGIVGKDTTPFLLKKIKEITGGSSLASNIQLVFNNVKTAARIAAKL